MSSGWRTSAYIRMVACIIEGRRSSTSAVEEHRPPVSSRVTPRNPTKQEKKGIAVVPAYERGRGGSFGGRKPLLLELPDLRSTTAAGGTSPPPYRRRRRNSRVPDASHSRAIT